MGIKEVLDYIGWGPLKKTQTNEVKDTPIENPVVKNTTKPAGRVSSSEYESPDKGIKIFNGFIKPEYDLDIIPILRKTTKSNPDVGKVYNDLIQLSNPGHTIIFDQSVDPIQAEKMKAYLSEQGKKWGSGVSGIDALINKWIGQIWVSGSLSNEWIPSKDLKSIENNVIVNPENILFKYDNKTTRYQPYQIVKNKLFNIDKNHIELNTNTYFYCGLNGDTDSPYGIPPFITAIEALATQKTMKKNINHILGQLGLLGYLEAKIDKPEMRPNESWPAYDARLDSLLVESKKNIINGFSDGVVVGYEGDHEFEFHATAKNLAGVPEVFNMNEVQVANALKTSPSMIGQKSNGTETNMSIVFTQMISQLTNVQNILSANLEMGYLLALRLAGFNVRSSNFKVEFNNSTITDDLKFWQAKEIKQRVLKNLRIDNIISNDTYAEGMGYNHANGPEPLVPYEDQVGKGSKDPEQKDKDKDVKNKSAKKSREKDKKQPRRK